MRSRISYSKPAFLLSLAAFGVSAGAALADVNGRLEQTIDAATVPLEDAVIQAMAMSDLPVAEATLGIHQTVTDWPVFQLDVATNTINENRFSIVDGSLTYNKTTVRNNLSNREQLWAQAVAQPITVLDAINIAQQQQEGDRVYEVKFDEYEDGNGITSLVWEARVLTADYLLVAYDIDPNTGEVLQGNVLEGGRRAELHIANVTLTDALDIASATLPTTTTLAANFVTLHARVYWAVWTEDEASGQQFKVVINPIRGDVVSVEALEGSAGNKTKDPAAAAVFVGLPLSMSDAVDLAHDAVGQGHSYAVWVTGSGSDVTYNVRILEGVNTIVSVKVDAFTGEVFAF